MTDKELDEKFAKMSRSCANKMNGTHPRNKSTKKTVKKSCKRK